MNTARYFRDSITRLFLMIYTHMHTLKIVLLALFVAPLISSAHGGGAALPKAGITPDSILFVFDRFGEEVREFFTFGSEAKARLHVALAGERIAEIKVIFEEKGIDAPGIEKAEVRLKAHFADAAAAIEESDEDEAKELARELRQEMDEEREALKAVFKERMTDIKTRIQALKAEIEAAEKRGDEEASTKLRAELEALKAEKEALDEKEDEHDEALEEEMEKVERQLEDKEEAARAISEAEEEMAEIRAEAATEGVIIAEAEFAKFDRMLAQAKELFERGNYQGAEQLAEQAEESVENLLDDAEMMEEMDEAMEGMMEAEIEFGAEIESDERQGGKINSENTSGGRR